MYGTDSRAPYNCTSTVIVGTNVTNPRTVASHATTFATLPKVGRYGQDQGTISELDHRRGAARSPPSILGGCVSEDVAGLRDGCKILRTHLDAIEE